LGASADNWTIKVINPDGKSSNVFSFSVVVQTPAPVISSINPASPIIADPNNNYQTITIYGANFINKPTIILTWTGQSGYTLPSSQVTYVSSTEIRMSIRLGASADNWTIKVINPDGKSSNVFSFSTSIDNPPNITLFNVGPKQVNVGATITISYTVTDDVGLKRVELWRTTDIYNSPNMNNWSQIKIVNLSNQKIYSGSFSDSLITPGNFWYGIHVIDFREQQKTEQEVGLGPIKVTIITLTSFKIGSRIMAIVDGATVCDENLLTILFNQEGGVHGTIIDGPKFATAGNLSYTGNWWKIQWDSEPPNLNGKNGWTAESRIQQAPVNGDIDKPDFTKSFYTTYNIFWQNGYAPASTAPPNPKLGIALGNCTWYVHGRLKELGYNEVQLNALTGNASDWDSQALVKGILINSSPSVGSIAQIDNVAQGLGHVAVVESINSDGTITVTESSYSEDVSSLWNFIWRHRTVYPSKFTNYIHITKENPTNFLSVDFTCDVNSGQAPLVVNFKINVINTSHNLLSYYLWWNCNNESINLTELIYTCGDPSNSIIGLKYENINESSKSISYIFDKPGIYNVKLLVKSSNSIFFTKSIRINVNTPNYFDYNSYLKEASIKYKIPFNLLKAIAFVESQLNQNPIPPSRDGGVGVMQLTGSTLDNAARLLGVTKDMLAENTPEGARLNILGGAAVLRDYVCWASPRVYSKTDYNNCYQNIPPYALIGDEEDKLENTIEPWWWPICMYNGGGVDSMISTSNYPFRVWDKLKNELG
ncbi:MAG: CHAP domain-containing protein, partial [Candidatus Thermoplasmatota archaeon]|nr:CHAP domain-containing protein [Candidatus Thermoplasmatota archaeon]